METSFKTGFAQISLAAQKIRVAQNLGGLQPPPPARTPMTLLHAVRTPFLLVPTHSFLMRCYLKLNRKNLNIYFRVKPYRRAITTSQS